MLEQLLAHLRNWFLLPGGVHFGTYTIQNGNITLPFLQDGQYFRILGSVFNDGLYQYHNAPTPTVEDETVTEADEAPEDTGDPPEDESQDDTPEPPKEDNAPELKDETFTGTVWALAVPRAVINLAEEIADWQEKYGESVASPYTSESFAGYSYTKASGAGDGGASGGWQAAFQSKLDRWRKLREI